MFQFQSSSVARFVLQLYAWAIVALYLFAFITVLVFATSCSKPDSATPTPVALVDSTVYGWGNVELIEKDSDPAMFDLETSVCNRLPEDFSTEVYYFEPTMSSRAALDAIEYPPYGEDGEPDPQTPDSSYDFIQSASQTSFDKLGNVSIDLMPDKRVVLETTLKDGTVIRSTLLTTNAMTRTACLKNGDI